MLPFLSVGGSLGQTRPIEGNERPTTLGYRGEVGVRVGRLWATGGIMSLDTTVVPAPRVYDTTYVTTTVGPRQAYFATVRGPIWKGIGLDVVGSSPEEFTARVRADLERFAKVAKSLGAKAE